MEKQQNAIEHRQRVNGEGLSTGRTGGTTVRAPLTLTLAVGSYDRTRPLIGRDIRPQGIVLNIDPVYPGEFCKRPVYEEYDVAEMSLSWYVSARCRGEPVIALPIFPLRMPVHAYLFCKSDSSYTQPGDLVGKRLGATRYRWTVNLWIRGILQEHYGLLPEHFSWVTTEEEGAGFVPRAGVEITCMPGHDPVQLLLDGKIDALLSPVVPEAFRTGNPMIRRLFQDCRAEIGNYFHQTGIFPITHTIVIGESLWKREPWIAGSLVEAFENAQRECEESYYAQPTPLSFPGAVLFMEEERATFGAHPWTHGVQPNRHVLETFVRYAYEQGYTSRSPTIDELFPAIG